MIFVCLSFFWIWCRFDGAGVGAAIFGQDAQVASVPHGENGALRVPSRRPPGAHRPLAQGEPIRPKATAFFFLSKFHPQRRNSILNLEIGKKNQTKIGRPGAADYGPHQAEVAQRRRRRRAGAVQHGDGRLGRLPVRRRESGRIRFRFRPTPRAFPFWVFFLLRLLLLLLWNWCLPVLLALSSLPMRRPFRPFGDFVAKFFCLFFLFAGERDGGEAGAAVERARRGRVADGRPADVGRAAQRRRRRHQGLHRPLHARPRRRGAPGGSFSPSIGHPTAVEFNLTSPNLTQPNLTLSNLN